MSARTGGSNKFRQFTHRQKFRKAIMLGIVMALTGCAARTQPVASPLSADDMLENKITSTLLDGKPEDAREILTAALRDHPQNGYLHLLNGLSYQVSGNSRQSLELASVGYDAAVKFAPGFYWSRYIAGSTAFEYRNYPQAAEQFSRAILDEPDRYQAFLGLADSAYFANDLGVARAASDRALLLAPTDPMVLRSAAYIAAASGDQKQVDHVLFMASVVPEAAHDLAIHKPRLAQLLRAADLDHAQSGADRQGPQDPSAAASRPAPDKAPHQVMIEVTILLNQDSSSRNIGINLLDGLSLQFGLEHTTKDEHISPGTSTLTETFTTALSVPQITYSLNLFNKKNDHYQVIARPSLVASIGQQSNFFIGRTVTIGVSGVNLGTLEPVDVGTAVRVTPFQITRDGSKFRVEVERSFFAEDSGGTFSQSLTTFKQTVGGTVEVEFGRTLILSSLHEGVNIGGNSKTPGLGDIPGVDLLFNERRNTQRRDAALILVTPRLPGFAETDTREFRSETLNKLLSLWKDVVEPVSNLDAIIEKLNGKFSKYFQAKSGDLHLPSVSDPAMVKTIVKESFAQMQ